jgi:hypothetical protein
MPQTNVLRDCISFWIVEWSGFQFAPKWKWGWVFPVNRSASWVICRILTWLEEKRELTGLGKCWSFAICGYGSLNLWK